MKGFNGNGSATIYESGHDPSSSLNNDTKGKRVNIEKTEILSLLRGIAREDGGLDCGTITIDDSLITEFGLMLLLGSSPMKKSETSLTISLRGYEWNHRPRRILMHVRLFDLGIAEDLLNRVRSTTENILEELFETGTSERSCGSQYTQRESISVDVWVAENKKRVRLVERSQVARRRLTEV